VTGGGVAAHYAGFIVSLHGTGLGTAGVVLCNRVRTLDLKARKARRVERAPAHVVQEVLAVLHDIFEL
jgi:mRNA-degrading endonuclease toxin of MazEF toxin-antitoxin module